MLPAQPVLARMSPLAGRPRPSGRAGVWAGVCAGAVAVLAAVSPAANGSPSVAAIESEPARPVDEAEPEPAPTTDEPDVVLPPIRPRAGVERPVSDQALELAEELGDPMVRHVARLEDRLADLERRMIELRGLLAVRDRQLENYEEKLSYLEERLEAAGVEYSYLDLNPRMSDEKRAELRTLAERQDAWEAEREEKLERWRRIRAQREAELESAREQAREEKENRPGAEVTWDIELIPIERDQEDFIQTDTGGEVIRRRDTSDIYDTRRVIVRGTVLNRSKAPWRYTFGVVATSSVPRFATPLNIKAAARHQTEVLGPNELESFAIPLSVKNSFTVNRIEIVDLTADNPGAGEEPRDVDLAEVRRF